MGDDLWTSVSASLSHRLIEVFREATGTMATEIAEAFDFADAARKLVEQYVEPEAHVVTSMAVAMSEIYDHAINVSETYEQRWLTIADLLDVWMHGVYVCQPVPSRPSGACLNRALTELKRRAGLVAVLHLLKGTHQVSGRRHVIDREPGPPPHLATTTPILRTGPPRSVPLTGREKGAAIAA
jgi:hypothetical protein